MKKTSLVILCFLICLTTVAQRRGRRQEPVYTVTAQEAMAAYNFSLAEEILESQIATLRRKNQPTDQEEALLETARKSLLRLRATQQVTIIDSLVLPKDEVLRQIRISEDCGTIMNCTELFEENRFKGCTLFCNELANRVIYAEPNASGHLRLQEKSKIGKEWSMQQQLTGFEEEKDDDLNYPFMLSDGITLYYGAKCEESIGGYDIFMTRYDADEQTFLSPENVGMPFNSPANDYLMVIDEFQQLGWFVTDRNQPADSVCLYVFIPSEIRRLYNVESVEPDMLASYARISCIRDTWQDQEAVAEAQKRLAEVRAEKVEESKRHQFTFVLNDSKTYHALTEFRNPEAQQKAKVWAEAQFEYELKCRELATLRDKYATMNEAQRTQVSPRIQEVEHTVEQLAGDKLVLEKEIRRLELGK